MTFQKTFLASANFKICFRVYARDLKVRNLLLGNLQLRLIRENQGKSATCKSN